MFREKINSFDVFIFLYENDEVLIPKNSSVLVARIPVQGGSKRKWGKPDLSLPIHNNVNLLNANSSEEDKIKAMITQSSAEYDPSKYQKSGRMFGRIPLNYICRICGIKGHWINDCPQKRPGVKRCTGIPRSMLIGVSGPEVKGALLTPSGQYAVTLVDYYGYKEMKRERAFQEIPKTYILSTAIPEEYKCCICKDILQDAVAISCCGVSFCDECVSKELIENENQECPNCFKKDKKPLDLVPNQALRKAVLNLRWENGKYIRWSIPKKSEPPFSALTSPSLMNAPSAYQPQSPHPDLLTNGRDGRHSYKYVRSQYQSSHVRNRHNSSLRQKSLKSFR